MKLSHLIWGAGAASAGLLLYGALFETSRLRVERPTLRLRGWPKDKDGYRIALLADMHLRDRETLELAVKAARFAVAARPDVIAIAGDTVAYWKPGVLDLVEIAFQEFDTYKGPILAVPGNHDYFGGDPDFLLEVFEKHKVTMLRNDAVNLDGVNWVGVDSANAGMADPYWAIRQSDPKDPIVVLWHEPDMVDVLPRGPELMLAGHSHGGQFITPWGWAPTGSENGRKYVRGFYPEAPVPIYVSRGLGTTGPPARLFCPAEVTLLTIRPL